MDDYFTSLLTPKIVPGIRKGGGGEGFSLSKDSRLHGGAIVSEEGPRKGKARKCAGGKKTGGKASQLGDAISFSNSPGPDVESRARPRVKTKPGSTRHP